MNQKAYVVFLNGSVVTVDQTDRVCQAVAVKGNRILKVGASDQVEMLVGDATTVIDLAGRSLLPGFVDAHCHPGVYGASQLQVRCGPENVKSIQDIQREIRKRAAVVPPGEWIIGRGYIDTELEEKRHPTRRDLDAAAPEHKVFINRTCGHIAVVNSRVLEAFDICSGTPDPEGGKIDRDDRGDPTGVLYEQAQARIKVQIYPSYTDLKAGLAITNRDFLRFGITSATEASGQSADEARLYQEGADEGWFKVRMYLLVRHNPPHVQLGNAFLKTGMITGFGNERVRLGAWKTILDGAGGGASAAMREPYLKDLQNYGILYFSQKELDEMVITAHLAGYQVAVHAIGDRAVEMTLNSYEKALKTFPRKNHRHRIEHAGFLDETALDRIQQLGIVPILGLPFLYELGDNYLEVFDNDPRLDTAYPLGSLLRRKIPAALSSDTPVIGPNPMHGIYFAVAHRSKSGQSIAADEAVDLMQAIRAYTANGAYASFEEHLKGSIEAGKLADLIVLSENILETAPEDLLGIKVDMTMVDGDMVYEKRQES